MIFTQKWVFFFSTAHPPKKPSGWVGKWVVGVNEGGTSYNNYTFNNYFIIRIIKS